MSHLQQVIHEARIPNLAADGLQPHLLPPAAAFLRSSVSCSSRADQNIQIPIAAL